MPTMRDIAAAAYVCIPSSQIEIWNHISIVSGRACPLQERSATRTAPIFPSTSRREVTS